MLNRETSNKHLRYLQNIIERTLFLTSIVSVLISSLASAQNNQSRATIARLDSLIQSEVSEKKLVGLAVGVTKNRKVIFEKGYGVAKLGEDSSVTPLSLFHLASLTKPFVATALIRLAEDGRVDIDSPITKYVPYFRLHDHRYRTITIRQMLSHISGMPDVKGDQDYDWDKPEYDAGALERYVRSLETLSLAAPPGTKFEYSNIAYEVLGDVIAKTSGVTFEDYVQSNIFNPLGMRHSTLLVKQADPHLLVTPHLRNKTTREPEVSKIFPYNRAHAPSSTLYSNVEDMNKWAIANLNHGIINGTRVWSSSSHDELWKPAISVGKVGDPTIPPDMKVGLSWFIWDYKGHRMIEHRGSDVGFRAYIVLAPDDAFSIVLLSNDAGASASILKLSRAAVDLLLQDADGGR